MLFRSIRLISGSSPFCEVFFSDVVAHERNVVGGIDQGWTVAKALLGHERSMVGEVFAQSVGAQAGTQARSETPPEWSPGTAAA